MNPSETKVYYRTIKKRAYTALFVALLVFDQMSGALYGDYKAFYEFCFLGTLALFAFVFFLGTKPEDLKKIPWKFYGLYSIPLLLLLFLYLTDRSDPWPLLYLPILTVIFLAGSNRENAKLLPESIVNAVLIYFFTMQIFAFFYRLYDRYSYCGAFLTGKRNAVFYFLALTAMLLKWYAAHWRGSLWIVKALCLVGAGFILSLQFFTLQPVALFGSLVLLMGTLLLMQERIRVTVLKALGVIGVAVILFPLLFLMLRHAPTALHTPLLYAPEYTSFTKIGRGALADDERYTEFEELKAEILSVYFGKPSPNEGNNGRDQSFDDSAPATLYVQLRQNYGFPITILFLLDTLAMLGVMAYRLIVGLDRRLCTYGVITALGGMLLLGFFIPLFYGTQVYLLLNWLSHIALVRGIRTNA